MALIIQYNYPIWLYIEVEARLVSFVTKEGEFVIVRPVVFFNPFATDFLNTVA